jgi:hypothetical protein
MPLHNSPWEQLPHGGRYVLERDVRDIEGRGKLEKLRLDLLPIPFQGDPERARVIFLMTNPGVKDSYPPESEALKRERRRSYHFESDPAFVSLSPRFPESSQYWRRFVFGELIRDGLEEQLMHHTMVVQYFPYWSRGGDVAWLGLPSQEYSFCLVRRAIEAEKLVVVLRTAKGTWPDAVHSIPGLERGKDQAHNVIWKPLSKRGREKRPVHVSPGNLGQEAYERVKEALEGR